jgi:transposase-like protein
MALSRCRISETQQIKLLELFVAQVTARTAADLTDVHRNTAALYYHKLRQCIAARMGEIEPELAVFECDEGYFGGARKGKRGRGAAGKVCVFGILKRGGRVYALPVADATRKTLLTALKTRVKADSVVIPTAWPATTFWTCPGSGIIGSITAKPSSAGVATTSTASRISGTNPNACCASTTAFHARISSCS